MAGSMKARQWGIIATFSPMRHIYMSGRNSAKTERALARVRDGEPPYSAALAEKLPPSTLYRALKRLREKKKKP